MPYRMRAVDLTRETSLPTTGPGTSARMTCISRTERAFDRGSTAIVNTSTPMPPIQCVKLRQKRIECGNISTFVRMLAPVVVKPDAVSNSASQKCGIVPDSRNGSAPNTDSSIHDSPTTTRPSFAKMSCLRGILKVSTLPSAISSTIGIRNAVSVSS